MNNKELDVLKDKHALGTLSDAEYASLEVELLQNPGLATELKLNEDLVKGVQYAGELELKTLLDKIHYQQSGEKSPRKKKSNILYYIAGLVLILSVAAFLLLNDKATEEVNTENIFAAYYTQYKPSLQDRGTSLDQSIVLFNQAYLAKEYRNSLTIIKPFLSDSDNDIKLMTAISAIEVNDFMLAESLLNEIIESKDYYFVDHALWYKALINVKMNQTTSVKETLIPITQNPKADHHLEAIELISKLNR